ncbi:MAG: hypothetical protein E7557_09740 [Ruminococcaceae bacterium]|nr:hypothetical protein [Oscillospiraceae bacterium]
MGKFLKLALGAAVVGAGVKIYKMPNKERADMFSRNFVKAISKFSNGLPEPVVNSDSEEVATAQQNELICEATKNSKWVLGYAQKSILPDDILTKEYCIGGVTRFPARFPKGVLDDIRVRAICLGTTDGSLAVFAVVDCIGLSNRCIKIIRQRLADFMQENNISSVNISSTHTHSSIDTMGIWGRIIEVFRNNRKVLIKGEGELMNSCDEEYMEFLYGKVIEAVKEAVADKSEGKLFKAYMGSSSEKYVSEDATLKERGIKGYVWDRREPNDCSCQLLRLRFQPTDKSKKETVLVNFSAHPYINSMSEEGKGTGENISGDFVYSLCEYLESAGNNAIFFNGAVAAIYPTRLYADVYTFENQAKAVGNELGRITLAMTKTNDEIYKDELLSPEKYEASSVIFADRVSSYRTWVEKKGEEVIEEIELEPAIKLKTKEVPIKVGNPIFELISKVRVGNYTVAKSDNKQYESVTEIGVLELGNKLKIAFIPGEIEPDIISGSDTLKKEYSFSGEDFSEPALKDVLEYEDLTVFGLTNDAMGYIIPDNDFSMMFLGSNKLMQKLFGNHYLEIFSFGKETASTLVKAFKELK